MTTKPGDPRPAPIMAFRRSLPRWFLVFLAGVVPETVFLTGVFVPSTHGWEKAANAAAAIAFATLGIRIARLGIFASPDGLTVRNYFHAHHVAWEQISALKMPPRYGTWRNTGLRIHLLDGRLISATLYVRGQLDSANAARKVIITLEEMRRQRAWDTGEPQPPSTAIPETGQPA